MEHKKKPAGKLKLLAGYYKPYKGLFFSDLFFAVIGAAVILIIPLLVRYIMNSVSSMPVQDARRILVLTENGIAEEGTHKELMEKDGVYAKLCRAGL